MNRVCSPRVLTLVLRGLLLAFLLTAAPPPAQATQPGSYHGYVYARLSGTVEQTESAIGPALINVDANGVVSQSGGGLLGQVDASGTIIWQTPNAFLFTTGRVLDGVVSATGSRTDAGLTTTFRLEARLSPNAFGAGGGFGQALRLVHPIPHADELKGAAFGDATYIAVGRGGMILRSSDTREWLHIPTGIGANLEDVAFGDGRFVAVGIAGLVLHSSNRGLSWSTAASGTSQDFYGVAHGNGRFVAVGRAGIHTSADGAAWTPATVAASAVDQWDSVDFVHGRFVAVGGKSGFDLHNEIITSTDGLSWSAPVRVNAGYRTGSFQTAYGNGRFVVTAASGLGARTYTFTADDGSDAAIHNQPVELRGLFFDPGRNLFLAAVDRLGGELQSSPDGVTWSLLSTNTGTRGEKLLLAGGRAVSAGLSLAVSADLENWTLLKTNAPTLLESPVTGAGFDRAYAANGILRGFASIGAVSTVPTILDAVLGPGNFLYGVGPIGTLMRLQTNPNNASSRLNSGTTVDLLGIGSNAADRGNAIVAVGQGGTILTSTDGFTWIPRSSGIEVPLRDVAADGVRLVAVGDQGTILTALVSDPSRWTPATSGTPHHLRAVANHKFVRRNDLVSSFIAVGEAGTILTSEDGTSWTQVTPPTTASLVSVLSAGARNPASVFALAADGALLQSTNHGAAWSDAGLRLPEPGVALSASELAIYAAGRDSRYLSTSLSGNTPWKENRYSDPPLSSGMTGVAHGNGRFVAVGPNSTGVSADGSVWTFQYLPAVFSKVAFGNGRFLAVGAGGVAASSLDGVHWDCRYLGANLLGDVTYGQDQFVAVGALGRAYLSTDGFTWTERATGGTTTLEAVAFGNGVYVAVGASQYTSTNGVSWQGGNLPRNQLFHDIHFAEGLFVRVGENSRAGIIQSSTNGTTWITRSQLTGNSQLYGVSRIGSLWVAVGEPPATGLGAGVYTSPDGVTWTPTSAHRNGPLRAIAAGNGTAVAVGDAATILKAEYPDLSSPIIQAPPADRRLPQGSSLTLSVQASGAAPLSFRWFRDGVALDNLGRISGATTATLRISDLAPADTGTYLVTVANGAGSRISSPAIVTVTEGGGGTPTFASWAASLGLSPGQDGPADDPDGDLLPNLAEYAFGSDPRQPDSNVLPAPLQVEAGGLVYPAITYLRDPRLQDVRIELGAGLEVDFATPVPTTEVLPAQTLPNGLERVTVRANTPVGALRSLFFRTSVVQGP